jgi:hypothetical protein
VHGISLANFIQDSLTHLKVTVSKISRVTEEFLGDDHLQNSLTHLNVTVSKISRVTEEILGVVFRTH